MSSQDFASPAAATPPAADGDAGPPSVDGRGFPAAVRRLAASRRAALAFVVLVACVWLNQSYGVATWRGIKERLRTEPGAHVVDAARYPFIFLYRRSGDEELYHATATAVVGGEVDPAPFVNRGKTPLPPVTTPADGRFHVPYQEVPFEYPPPNVPFVVLPRLLASDFETYARIFCATMGLLLAASAVVGARLGARGDARSEALRLWGFGLLLLAHGAIAVQRLDAIVAVLVALLVRAAVARRAVLVGFLGGLLGATKMVPVLATPAAAFAAGLGPRRGPGGLRQVGEVVAGGALGLALGLGPMVTLSPAALPMLLAYHGQRGLHVESTFGVIYGAVKLLAGRPERAFVDFGSFNFHGAVADALARAALPLTLVLVALATLASLPAPPDGASDAEDERRRAVRVPLAVLAALAALWLGGKVFSPQYLTWALPVVVALPGRRALAASVGLGVCLFAGQLFFRGYYDHVYNQLPVGVATMVIRLAVLVAGFVVLLRELRRTRAPEREPR